MNQRKLPPSKQRLSQPVKLKFALRPTRDVGSGSSVAALADDEFGCFCLVAAGTPPWLAAATDVSASVFAAVLRFNDALGERGRGSRKCGRGRRSALLGAAGELESCRVPGWLPWRSDWWRGLAAGAAEAEGALSVRGRGLRSVGVADGASDDCGFAAPV